MAQDRKVFVGGVPQDLNQDALYTIFSEYAGVKKAWLQKCRAADDNNSSNSPGQNHRGFGFVIFHDPCAIEELLGGRPSRFIVLRNGAKLEVKRALSSSKIHGVSTRPDATAWDSATLWSPGAGRGPLSAQGQALRGSVEQQMVQRQDVLVSRLPAHVQHSTMVWPSEDGTVLAQLSLMPHGTGGYHNGDLIGNGVQGMMPLVGSGGEATIAAGTLPPYVIAGQQMSAQSLHVQQEMSGTSGPTPSKGSLCEAIVQFYKQHQPDKLTEEHFLERICSYYKDREGELDEALRQKYGAGLSFNGGSLKQQCAPSTEAQSYFGAHADMGQPLLHPNGPAAFGHVNGNGAVLATTEPVYSKPGTSESDWPPAGRDDASQFTQQAPASKLTTMSAQPAWFDRFGDAAACEASGRALLGEAVASGDDETVFDNEKQGYGDAGFEISVEVAEAIIG